MRVISVVGARPNFMKVAPLHRVLQRRAGFAPLIVRTGQHYDEKMSEVFFRQLEMPEPDLYLGVGSGTHAEQTARVDRRAEVSAVDGDLTAAIRASPVWRAKEDLLRGVPGVGRVLAMTILADLPELGRLRC